MDKETEQLKNYALKALNALFRKDPWVKELYKSAGFDLHKASALLDEILANEFFDSATDEGLAVYEKDLGITEKGSLTERRERVEALWKATGKATLERIANIVDQYVGNRHETIFNDQEIHVQFHDDSYLWALETIKESIGIIKPAHIPLIIEDIREFDGNQWIGGYTKILLDVTVDAYTDFENLDVVDELKFAGYANVSIDITTGG